LTQPVFPDTYAEGRGRFVELVSACKGTHQAHQHPLEGPEGERLYTDVATWGSREASTAVALIAGTHGIEGFAGSGIMATLLSEELPGKIPGDVKLVMIHALNPFGFAWERRVNENNVDLNRNFVDHDSAYPANPLYAELAELVTPRTWEETTLEDIAEGFRTFQAQHGVNPAEVFSKGQYTHPDGFFFGGNARAWSNELLTSIASEHLSNAELVLDIDIHTGLGPFAEAEYIIECTPASSQYRLAQAIWGDRLRSTATGASRSANVSGSAMSGLGSVLGERLAGIGLEFGTLRLREMFNALIAERWLHVHGERDSSLGARIRAQMRAAFYPDNADWKAAVTAIARTAVQQAIDYAR
jgi:hypothetical protein